MVIMCVGVSASGHSSRISSRTVRRKVPTSPVSIAVTQTSPSPCAPCPSPTENSAPSVKMGRYKVVPATSSLLSILPPLRRGGGVGIRPQEAGGATAMTPKNGRSGISWPQGNRPIMRA